MTIMVNATVLGASLFQSVDFNNIHVAELLFSFSILGG